MAKIEINSEKKNTKYKNELFIPYFDISLTCPFKIDINYHSIG